MKATLYIMSVVSTWPLIQTVNQHVGCLHGVRLWTLSLSSMLLCSTFYLCKENVYKRKEKKKQEYLNLLCVLIFLMNAGTHFVWDFLRYGKASLTPPSCVRHAPKALCARFLFLNIFSTTQMPLNYTIWWTYIPE